MEIFSQGDVRLAYVEQGSGPVVLLIAPGGMRSAASWWDRAPWNPVEHLAGTHRVNAMDKRNAGSSTAPVTGTETWSTYTADQLALLDHLGVDSFAVLGMCIGGPYALGLAAAAPERVTGVVALQTIGLDGNRHAFEESFDAWAAELAPQHPEADAATWASYRSGMYADDHTLFSVPDAELGSITTPLLVLPGDDLHHPRRASDLLASAVPGARVVERWKDPVDVPAARSAVAEFLA